MCNAYKRHLKWVEYVQMMQALESNIPTHRAEFDLREAGDIRIGDLAPVMPAAEADFRITLIVPKALDISCYVG